MLVAHHGLMLERGVAGFGCRHLDAVREVLEARSEADVTRLGGIVLHARPRHGCQAAFARQPSAKRSVTCRRDQFKCAEQVRFAHAIVADQDRQRPGIDPQRPQRPVALHLESKEATDDMHAQVLNDATELQTSFAMKVAKRRSRQGGSKAMMPDVPVGATSLVTHAVEAKEFLG
jgi:hypothetical protein